MLEHRGNRRRPPPFDFTRLLFAVYKTTLEGRRLSFWATAEDEDVCLEGVVRDDTVPETGLPADLFSDDFGENIRCGNIYQAVKPLVSALAAECGKVYLSDPKADRAKLRVLELGSGMGLPGLWAAAAGCEVTLTDSHSAVLELLERSCRLNGLSAVVRRLHFGDAPVWLADGFDLVLAADVMYEEGQAELLFRTAAAALRLGGVFLLGHKERSNLNLPSEIAFAERHGLVLVAGEATCNFETVQVFRFEWGPSALGSSRSVPVSLDSMD